MNVTLIGKLRKYFVSNKKKMVRKIRRLIFKSVGCHTKRDLPLRPAGDFNVPCGTYSVLLWIMGHLSCKLFLLDNEKFAKSCKKQEEMCFVSSWKEHLFLSKCRTSIRWLDPFHAPLWYVLIPWSYAFSSTLLLILYAF